MEECQPSLNMQTQTSHSTHKTCRVCGISKPLSDYYRKRDAKDGRENSCIECRRKRMSQADKKRYDSSARRENHLIRTYAITQSVYEHLLLMQGGGCAICGSNSNGRTVDEFFVVDHCHKTDQIRGLLCHPCNAALGLLKDNISSLQNAISYLSKYA